MRAEQLAHTTNLDCRSTSAVAPSSASHANPIGLISPPKELIRSVLWAYSTFPATAPRSAAFFSSDWQTAIQDRSRVTSLSTNATYSVSARFQPTLRADAGPSGSLSTYSSAIPRAANLGTQLCTTNLVSSADRLSTTMTHRGLTVCSAMAANVSGRSRARLKAGITTVTPSIMTPLTSAIDLQTLYHFHRPG